MTELEVSGELGSEGSPYLLYLLNELSAVKTPTDLENITGQIGVLESLGTISPDVAGALRIFISNSRKP
jgi:hypothetical protein